MTTITSGGCEWSVNGIINNGYGHPLQWALFNNDRVYLVCADSEQGVIDAYNKSGYGAQDPLSSYRIDRPDNVTHYAERTVTIDLPDNEEIMI